MPNAIKATKMNQAELHLYRILAEMLYQNSASISSPAQKVKYTERWGKISRLAGQFHGMEAIG